MHGALDDGVRRLRIHHVQQNVNHFVASDSKNGSTQNLFRFCINADFDEASRYNSGCAFFSRRTVPGFNGFDGIYKRFFQNALADGPDD
jgi:hypothetical protein